MDLKGVHGWDKTVDQVFKEVNFLGIGIKVKDYCDKIGMIFLHHLMILKQLICVETKVLY